MGGAFLSCSWASPTGHPVGHCGYQDAETDRHPSWLSLERRTGKAICVDRCSQKLGTKCKGEILS